MDMPIIVVSLGMRHDVLLNVVLCLRIRCPGSVTENDDDFFC